MNEALKMSLTPPPTQHDSWPRLKIGSTPKVNLNFFCIFRLETAKKQHNLILIEKRGKIVTGKNPQK